MMDPVTIGAGALAIVFAVIAFLQWKRATEAETRVRELEAKLFGHYATHAFAAYLAALRGFERLDEVGAEKGLVDELTLSDAHDGLNLELAPDE